MPWIPSIRQTFLLMALTCAAAMGFALWLQTAQGLEPCPLCIFQRVAVISTSVIALLAALHHPAGLMRRVYALLTALTALAGIIVAGRHVWLQHLPPDLVPACGPGLDYWIAALPWQQVIQQVFHGSGECAKVDWVWLGLSLPGWVLVLCAGLFSAALWQGLRRR